MIPFPTEFPLDAITGILALAKSGGLKTKPRTAFQCIGTIVFYAGQFIPEAQVVTGECPCPGPCPCPPVPKAQLEEVLAALEELQREPSLGTGPVGNDIVDAWQWLVTIALPYVIKLVKQWLASL